MAASGIRFNDHLFSEPIELAAWHPPHWPGLIAVLVSDPNWAPKAFQPLYFGEFGNNTPASALLPDCSPLFAAAKGKALFVSLLPMPFSTTQQRLALRRELILAYNPLCHEYKLTELERKHREPTEQILYPAPPAPRRRIGFVS